MSDGLTYRLFGHDVSATKSLKGVAAEADRTGKALGDRIGKGAVAAGVAIGSLAAQGIVGLVNMGVSAIQTGVQTAAAMEQAQVGFTTLIGSGEKAKAFLGDLSSFAASTPFEMNGLIESSRTLLGVGVAAKDVIPMLTDFGDAAGAVGLGQDQFQRIMIATSQALAAGKFQTADLNQITNNGLPVWSILSKAMGKPVSTLRDMASHGKLLAKDVLPLLQKEMHKDYGGAMAKQSQTLSGIWSTLQDTFSQGMAQVLLPMMPMLKDLANKGIGALSAAFKFLAEWGPKVADAIKVTAMWLGEHLGPVVQAVGQWIGDTLIPAVKDLADGFMKNVWPAIQKVAGIIGENLQPIIGALADFWTNTLLPALQAAWPVIQKIALVIGVVIAVIAIVVAWIIGKLIPVILWLASKVIPLAIWWVGKIVDALIGIGLAAKSVWDFVSTWFGKVVGFVSGLPDRITSAVSGLWDGIKTSFKAALNWIIDAWNNFQIQFPSFNFDWNGPLPGGEVTVGGWTVNTPNIPRLAQGALIRHSLGGTPVIVGEGSEDEIVAPLSKVRGLAGGGGGTVVNITVQGDTDPRAAARRLAKIMQDGREYGIAF